MTTRHPISACGSELLFIHVANVHRIATARIDLALRVHGLRNQTYGLLAVTCSSKGGIDQRRAACELGLDLRQINSLADELEEAGLVTRSRGAHDRRCRTIISTPRGQDRRLLAEELVRTTTADIFEHCSPEAMATRGSAFAGGDSDKVRRDPRDHGLT